MGRVVVANFKRWIAEYGLLAIPNLVALLGGIALLTASLVNPKYVSFQSFAPAYEVIVLWYLLALSFRSSVAPKSSDNTAYAKQAQFYRQLIKYIDDYGVDSAVMIQYSCASAIQVLETLLEKKAQIRLFVQNPKTAKLVGAMRQETRISYHLEMIEEIWRDQGKPARLRVYRYDQPASISGIKIKFLNGRTVLMMGWYTYDVRVDDRSMPWCRREVEVSGHDRAAVIVWDSTPEYAALHDTFETMVRVYTAVARPVDLRRARRAAHRDDPWALATTAGSRRAGLGIPTRHGILRRLFARAPYSRGAVAEDDSMCNQ